MCAPVLLQATVQHQVQQAVASCRYSTTYVDMRYETVVADHTAPAEAKAFATAVSYGYQPGKRVCARAVPHRTHKDPDKRVVCATPSGSYTTRQIRAAWIIQLIQLLYPGKECEIRARLYRSHPGYRSYHSFMQTPTRGQTRG